MKQVFFTLLTVCLFGAGLAIKCHQCDSNKDKNCENLVLKEAVGERPAVLREDYAKECPARATYCRKIDQNIQGEYSVIRQCGYDDTNEKRDAKSCYSTILQEYNTNVCQCDTDLCNSGFVSSSSTVLTLVAAIVSAVVMRHF